MNSRWSVRHADPDIWNNLTQQLALSPVAARILINRGIKTPEQADRFVRPSLSHLQSPWLMKDMNRAVDRVIRALHSRECVGIYGDYDVDGMTATAVLVSFLRELGMNPTYYIPHRVRESYGLNLPAIRGLRADGVRLLITADCGVSNQYEIAEANRLGMETIVIDHHAIPEMLPPAVAVLNPKRPDCSFPFEGLAGVGVAFLLIVAMRVRLREMDFWSRTNPPNLRRYLDLVCLGTIADLVPLVDQNRVLVKFGLEELSRGGRKGIQALKERSHLGGRAINTGNVAFQLSPRLNACGRLDHAAKAVELFLTDSMDAARNIASELDALNEQRQRTEDEILSEILENLEREPNTLEALCLFFSSPAWHPGVIGIVASRLVERFGKPAVLISVDANNVGRGSARGINGLDLYEALHQCKTVLSGFGGHRMAAGFTVRSERIEDLRCLFERAVGRDLSGRDDLAPRLFIDAEISLPELDRRLLEELSHLEPYGMGNPRPLFLCRNVAVCDRRVVGGDSLKLRVKDKRAFDAIGFRMAGRIAETTGQIDLVFTPQLNHWSGLPRIELEMRDILPHSIEENRARPEG